MNTLFLRIPRFGAALVAGLFLFAAPAAQAQLTGQFGAPFRPFNGQMTFKAGVPALRAPDPGFKALGRVKIGALAATPSLTINVKPGVDNAWAVARGTIAQTIRNKMGVARKFRGQTAYNINVVLANRGELQAMADGPRLAFKYFLRGNSVTAKITTPTVFGSYADPKFTVTFDMELIANVGRLPDGKIGVTSVHAYLHNSRLQGRNVTGTIGLAIADVVGSVGGPDVRGLAQNAIDTQNFKQSLNIAFVPVAFPGSLFSQMSGSGVLVRLIAPTAPGTGPVVR